MTRLELRKQSITTRVDNLLQNYIAGAKDEEQKNIITKIAQNKKEEIKNVDNYNEFEKGYDYKTLHRDLLTTYSKSELFRK